MAADRRTALSHRQPPSGRRSGRTRACTCGFSSPQKTSAFRGAGALHRWVTAPRLVIQRRALRFTDLTSFSYEATASLMADAEMSVLVADLEWALAQLTGGTFTYFAGVDVEAADEGAASRCRGRARSSSRATRD
jgi:hypothetical protein